MVLNLLPCQMAPCGIGTLEWADAILARGPQLALDGSGVDVFEWATDHGRFLSVRRVV